MYSQSESIKEIAGAIAKAQAKMKNPKLDCTNPFYKSKYASLAAIRDEAVPAFAAEGIAVIQTLGTYDSVVNCTTSLLHSSGEWIQGTFGVPVTKEDAQGYGAASTYARRYLLQAMSGIVGDEDDDANAAVGTKSPVVSTPKKKEYNALHRDGSPLLNTASENTPTPTEGHAPQGDLISDAQCKRLYAIAKGV